MRQSSLIPALAALILALASARGDDVNSAVAINGEGIRAECTLNEAPTCQNVLVVNEVE